MEYSDNVNRLVFVDRVPFKSVVWEERYNDIGKMQAVFPITADAVSIVKVGRFAVITPTSEFSPRAMYIHSVRITATEVWAYGSEAKCLWQKAGMMNLGDNNGEVTVKTRLESVISTNGNFSFLGLVTFPNLGTGNYDSLEYNNVYEYITKILDSKNAGWGAGLQVQNGTISINARVGVDKSGTVRFGTFLGNAVTAEYTVDNQSYMNRVYAVGQADDDIVVVQVDQTNSDHEIYSAYLDKRLDFPKPEEMTLEDYQDALQTRAYMSVIARHVRETLKISDINAEEYGSEYTLGDIVGVVIDDLNLTAKRRVVAVKRVLEGNNDKLSIELGAV